MILSYLVSSCVIFDQMRPGYSAVVGAALVALFTMTAGAETSPAGGSGIEGTVFVSPSRPGPIRKDDGPSVAPVGNAQFLVKAGEAAVNSFTTDGEGHFQVELPPGHYVIVREGAAPAIGHWRFEADVVAGRMTKVNWTADSGMR